MNDFVRLDESAVARLTSYLNGMPQNIPKAIARAMNRAIASVKTEASRSLRAKYTLKNSTILETLQIRKASPNDLVAAMLSRSNVASLPLNRYKVSPKSDTTGNNRQVVKVTKVKGNPFKVDKGFIWRGNVFRREGNGRLPIKKLTGPTVPQLLNSEALVPVLSDKAESTFMKRLDHEVTALLKGNTK